MSPTSEVLIGLLSCIISFICSCRIGLGKCSLLYIGMTTRNDMGSLMTLLFVIPKYVSANNPFTSCQYHINVSLFFLFSEDFILRDQLFVIEEDFIHLREGAQEIISATTAAAKVAAAASAPYSSSLPSVAVTPVAQPYRLKKVPTADANSGKTSLSSEGAAAGKPADVRPSQLSTIQDKHSNGVGLNIAQGISNVKILSKPKDIQEPNGFSSETRPGHSSVHMTIANGANPGVAILHNKGSSNGRHRTNLGGKQQGR